MAPQRSPNGRRGRIGVATVPKTIDNDLPLPENAPTFGFETARSVGAGILESLMEDARTTARWYVVVCMGRKSGSLSLGMCKAAGSTLAVLPEEFPEERDARRGRRYHRRRHREATRVWPQARHRGRRRRHRRDDRRRSLWTRREFRPRLIRKRTARRHSARPDSARCAARSARRDRRRFYVARQRHRLRTALCQARSVRCGLHAHARLRRRALSRRRRKWRADRARRRQRPPARCSTTCSIRRPAVSARVRST